MGDSVALTERPTAPSETVAAKPRGESSEQVIARNTAASMREAEDQAVKGASKSGSQDPEGAGAEAALKSVLGFTPEQMARVQQKLDAVPQVNEPARQPSEIAGGNGITQEAANLLNSVDASSVPAFLSRNIERIARQNGIDVTPSTTPNQIIDALRARSVAAEAPGPDVVSSQPEGAQSPQNQHEAQNNQATDAQLEASLDATARQQVADKNQRIKEFQSWTPDQLADEISVFERRQNMAAGMMQKGSPEETQRLGREQFHKAQDRLDELRSAQRGASGKEKTTDGETDVDRARREVQARLDYNQKLSEMNVGQLNIQLQLEQGNLTDLEGMLKGPITRAERDAITEKIRDTKARFDTVDKYKSLKEPGEREQQSKSEAEAQKAEEAKEHEELLRARAETASTKDIQDFEANISFINGEISDFEKKYAELDRQIAAEVDKDAKTELAQRRKELRKTIVDARNRLKTYESALETATSKKTEAEDEFGRLDSDGKVAELLRLAGKGKPLTEAQYKDLCKNIASGEFTIEQFGKLVDYMGRNLASGKADREMIANLTALGARSAEFGLAVLQKITDTKEGAAKIKEMFPDPSAWEKLLKLAGKNKGLLKLLLAILGIALAVATVTVKTAGSALVGEKK